MEAAVINAEAPVPAEPVISNATIAPQPIPVTNNKEVEKPKISDHSSKKHDRGSRKKDDNKTLENIQRVLSGYDSAEKKLHALCKMHAETLEENKSQQHSLKQCEKRINCLLKEKEHAQADYSKAVLTRSRLENLCRELQRQNKAIKDESILKIKEEEEKRKEISAKFQGTLAEITTLMNDINEKNSKLRDDNTDITNKFKTVCEQYDVRVQQVEKMSNQMQLETALSEAKLKKAHLEAQAERETMLKEKQEILLENAKYKARIEDLLSTESTLRSEISVYTDKYEEFHKALSRSNEVFVGFKDEMDKMSKKIIKLEKETASWKHRWEKSHAALLGMAADKQLRDQELSLSTRQLTQLQKLCRTLTEERAKLMTAVQNPDPNSCSGEQADTSKVIDEVLEENKKLNETLDNLQTLIAERERLQQVERNATPIAIPPVSSSPPGGTPTPPAAREDKKKSKKQKNRVNATIATVKQNGCVAKPQRQPVSSVNGGCPVETSLENGELNLDDSFVDPSQPGGNDLPEQSSVDVVGDLSESISEVPITQGQESDSTGSVSGVPVIKEQESLPNCESAQNSVPDTSSGITVPVHNEHLNCDETTEGKPQEVSKVIEEVTPAPVPCSNPVEGVTVTPVSCSKPVEGVTVTPVPCTDSAEGIKPSPVPCKEPCGECVPSPTVPEKDDAPQPTRKGKEAPPQKKKKNK